MERAARLGLRAFGVSETCPGVSGSALRQLMMGDWGGEQSSAMEAVETMLYPTCTPQGIHTVTPETSIVCLGEGCVSEGGGV
jgi:hypothetical protein